MDFSKLNQPCKEYECGLGVSKTNLFTGKVTFEYPLLSAGNNSYQISASLVYNSTYKTTDFSSKKIGLGNGWKLSIEQYVFEYQDNWRMLGYEVGDYVYIDNQWNIHRMVKYSTYNNEYLYYDPVEDANCNALYFDDSGSCLKMLKLVNGTFVIIDANNNRYRFNSQGELREMESSINSSIKKIITKSNNGNSIILTDERNNTRQLEYLYNDGLLTYVTSTVDAIGFRFEYDEYQNLIQIIKYNASDEKTVINFEYVIDENNNSLLSYVINGSDSSGLKYEYNSNCKITKVFVGAIKKIPTINGTTSEVFPGDGSYVGENNYVTNNIPVLGKYLYSMPETYIVKEDSYEYKNGYTQITERSGIKINYYFNNKEEVISILEERASNKYNTLEVARGWSLSTLASDNDESINGYKTTILNANKLSWDKFNIDNVKSSFDNVSLADHFNLSFWVKTSSEFLLTCDAVMICTLGDQTKEYKAWLEKTKSNVWQQVTIPVDFGADLQVTNDIRLKLQTKDVNGNNVDGSIDIVDMRMTVGNIPTIMVNDTAITNNSTIRYIEIGDSSNGVTVQNISSDFYLTEKDLFLTYKSMYLNSLNNNGVFDLVYCNGTKIKLVNMVALDNNSFNIIEGIPNYKIKSVRIMDEEDWLVTTSQVYYFNDYYVVTSNNVVKDKPLDNNNSISAKVESYEGMISEEISPRGFRTSYVYDEQGNMLFKGIYSKNEIDPEICCEYNYSQTGEFLTDVVEERIITHYEYNSDGTLKSETCGESKITYVYDTYKENVTQLIFNDDNNGQANVKNDIIYLKNGNIKYMKDHYNTTYGFKYNIFNDIDNVYKNKRMISESQTIYTNTRTAISTQKPYISYQEYNKYGKITDLIVGGTSVIFEYEPTTYNKSPSQSRLTKIIDNFSNETKNISYDDDSVNPSTTLEIPNKQKIKTTNNSIEYTIKTGENEELYISTVKRNNKSNSVIDETHYYIKDNGDYLEECADFSVNYYYNELGQYCQKAIHSIFQADIYEVKRTKDIEYLEGTQNPSSYVYTFGFHNYDSSFMVESNLNYHNEYRNGNIVSFTKGGQYFEENIQSQYNCIVSSIIEQKYVYEYDCYNRLICEKEQKSENKYINIYRYYYSNATGMLERVTKQENENSYPVEVKRFTYNNGKLTSVTINNVTKPVIYCLDNEEYISNIQGMTLEYNERKQISQINHNNGNVRYEYNYQGIRTKKIITDEQGIQTTITYFIDGDKIIGENWINNTGQVIKELRYFYDLEGIAGIRYNGHNYHLIKDTLGNVNKIMYKGKLIGEYDYDAWGNCTIHEISVDPDSGREEFVLYNNPFRYKGYYYDIETSLFWLSSRYYSPELCRFISPDDVDYLDPESVNGLNLYCYCYNNPISYSDPSGHLPQWAEWLIGGAVIVGLGIATVFTGGAAGVILGAAFYGAVTGAVSSAVIGGIAGAITGGWEGFLDGAASGFMSGAIIGGATGALTAGLNYALGGVKIIGSAQKTGNLFHRFSSNVQAGKFAMQIGRYSEIGLNSKLKTVGLNGAKRPDVTAVARIGKNKLIEVVSKTQTVLSQQNKINAMLASNPGTTGRVVSWALQHWFYF